MSRRYAVVTPARDEEAHLPATIASLVAQTERPHVWVIVDDGSTDGTARIAREAAAQHPWIRVLDMPPRKARVLGAGVVQAFKAGLATIDLADVDYVSKLDSDLVIGPRYYALLMDRMEADPRLGTASGQAWVRHPDGTETYERGAAEVSIGQAKFYRLTTLQEIGGLAETLAWDGIDVHEARIRGWRSRNFDDPELRVMTLRPEGASDRSVLRGRRRRGRGQWILGSDPLFMGASALLRVRDAPAVLGTVNTLFGYAKAAATRVPQHGDAFYRAQVRRFQRESLVLGKSRATRRAEARAAWQAGEPQRRIGMLVSQHPTLSHTFITREIAGLRELGWQVQPISLRPGTPVHGDDDTLTLRRLPTGRMARHLADAARHPEALLSGLTEALLPTGARRPRPIGLAYLGQALLLLGEARRADLRHVHVHFANNAAEVARLAGHIAARQGQARPLPYSLTIHGLSMHGATSDPDTDVFPRLNAAKWGPLAVKVRQAVAVRCVDAATARRVADVTGRDDLEVVHVGVDLATLTPRPTEPQNEEFTIGFVGRLAPEKQLPLLLEACARLRTPHWRLLVAGEGPSAGQAREAAQALGVQHRVEWLGAVEQHRLPALLAGLDVLAMSSRHEGVPVVLMEAMATGVPVVAPAVGGIPELVDDGRTGLLTTPGSATGLAETLDRLAADPQLRRDLARGGRARIETEFDARRQAPVLAAWLERLLPGRRSRAELAPL